MSWGLGSWGGTPYGGAPLSVPSSISGVVKLPPVNLEPGSVVQFPAATATLNGTLVTSPCILDEPGYYELFVETTPSIVQPITVVDIDHLVIQNRMLSYTNDSLGPYKNMVAGLPRVYGHGPRALPRYITDDFCLDLSVNAAVTATVRLINREGAQSDIGRILAPTAGRYRSAQFVMPPGQIKAQAVVGIELSPYVVQPQYFLSIDNTIAAVVSSTPATAVGFTAAAQPTAVDTNSNFIAYDKNSYTAVGIGAYANNYQAVERLAYNAAPPTYVSMSGIEDAGSFRMDQIAGVTGPFGIDQICIARNISAVLASHVTPFVLDAIAGEIKFGKTWVLPPDSAWYLPRTRWSTNPFVGQQWNLADIGAERYRFGLLRDTTGGTVQWQALVVLKEGIL